VATAVENVAIWLLVEYRERWPRDIADTPFPAAVRARLDDVCRRPDVRMQLIRNETSSGPYAVYVVIAGPMGAVHRFEVERHEDLLTIDFEGLLTGELTGRADARPVYLVCTHGQRDVCCAKRGVAFYRALLGQRPNADVWQSSHQGGHRFAATSIYLPAGVHYGRLEAGEADGVVAAHVRGELFGLGRYRGQTRYSRPTQAAEAWLRQQLGVMDIDGFELLEDRPVGEGRHSARFRAGDDTLHGVTVEKRMLGIARMASCNDGKPERPSSFEIVRHEAETPSGPPPRHDSRGSAR
jgi:hypothetical protein